MRWTRKKDIALALLATSLLGIPSIYIPERVSATPNWLQEGAYVVYGVGGLCGSPPAVAVPGNVYINDSSLGFIAWNCGLAYGFNITNVQDGVATAVVFLDGHVKSLETETLIEVNEMSWVSFDLHSLEILDERGEPLGRWPFTLDNSELSGGAKPAVSLWNGSGWTIDEWGSGEASTPFGRFAQEEVLWGEGHGVPIPDEVEDMHHHLRCTVDEDLNVVCHEGEIYTDLYYEARSLLLVRSGGDYADDLLYNAFSLQIFFISDKKLSGWEDEGDISIALMETNIFDLMAEDQGTEQPQEEEENTEEPLNEEGEDPVQPDEGDEQASEEPDEEGRGQPSATVDDKETEASPLPYLAVGMGLLAALITVFWGERVGRWGSDSYTDGT